MLRCRRSELYTLAISLGLSLSSLSHDLRDHDVHDFQAYTYSIKPFKSGQLVIFRPQLYS